MMSSARHMLARTTRATTIGPPRSSVMTRACAALIFGKDSRQPSTSPSATRLPSTFTRSSSRPVMVMRPFLSMLAEIARAAPAVGADAADRDAVVALGQVNLGHRQHRQRLRARPDRPDLAGREPIALRARDAHLDALERACPTVSGSLPARSMASGPAWVLW